MYKSETQESQQFKFKGPRLRNTEVQGQEKIDMRHAAAKLLQSCPTLCDPIDGSPPGSSVPGILQARTLEWVAISFSKAWKWKVKVKSLSRVQPFETPWTAAYQAPPSMGFSRQEYWSGLPVPSLRHVSSRESQFSLPLSFCSTQALSGLADASPHCWGPSSLLHLLNQTLISSRDTLIDIPIHVLPATWASLSLAT